MKAYIIWSIAAFLGFIDIILQAYMPDIVPQILASSITGNPQIIGYDLGLEAALIIYVLGGSVLFISGLFMACRSYTDNQSY